MIAANLKWAADVMGGEFLHGSPDLNFRGVSTDTRKIQNKNLFFCLVSGRDGHQFAKEARDKGAAGIVIDENHRKVMAQTLKEVPMIAVSDTLVALGDLAHHWRKQFTLPIVAITGSNGKTTTKELVKAILSTQHRVLATEGNFNNLIGVPKTIFRLEKKDEIAVIEMGMNDFGEIHRLTKITEPTVGLITNVAAAHLEKLKDVIGVAKAKGELFAQLKPVDWAIVNQKDDVVKDLRTPAKTLPVGTPETGLWGEVQAGEAQDNRPLHLKIHYFGKDFSLKMKIPGSHNLDNVLLALAVGYHFKIPIEKAREALEDFEPAPSRMQFVALASGVSLIDDCYNANPASTKAALKTLEDLKRSGKSLAILGDMNELGNYTVTGHREVGKAAANSGLDFLVTVGSHGKETLAGAQKGGMSSEQLRYFTDVNSAMGLMDHWPAGVQWILVKGSRTVYLEKLVSLIKEKF